MIILEKIKKLVGAIKFERKVEIRRRLLASIENQDARNVPAVRHIKQRSLFSFLKPMPIFAVLVIVSLLGGGVSLAAEQSLPGDALHAVKLNINEKVVKALSFSEKGKANWDTRLAERRLEEISELVAAGKLSSSTQALVEELFRDYAEKVQERIAKMEKGGAVKDAEEIASRFESSLRAHERVLEKFNSKVEKLKQKLGEAESRVAQARKNLENAIKSATSTPENQSAAEGKIKAASNFLDSTRKYLENRKEKLGTGTTSPELAEAIKKAEEKLVGAEKILAEAETKLLEGKYGEAFVLASKSMRAAQEARLSVVIEMKILKRADDHDDEDEENENDGDEEDDDHATTSANILEKVRGKGHGRDKD